MPCEWCPERHNSVRHRCFPQGWEVPRSTEMFVPLSKENGQIGGVVLVPESENSRQSDHSGRMLQHDNYTGSWGVTGKIADRPRVACNERALQSNAPKINTPQT